MRGKINEEQYAKLFKQNPEMQKEALEKADNTRRFEISNYWIRTGYFWTIMVFCFTGFFAVVAGAKKFELQNEFALLLTTLGLMVSTVWYFSNRGSKYWQNNWEAQVDRLEDEVTGPLYKIVLDPKQSKFWKLHKDYPFSVSKLNQLISLFISILWLILFVTYSIINLQDNKIIGKWLPQISKIKDLPVWDLVTIVIIFVGVFSILCFVLFGKTKHSHQHHSFIMRTEKERKKKRKKETSYGVEKVANNT